MDKKTRAFLGFGIGVACLAVTTPFVLPSILDISSVSISEAKNNSLLKEGEKRIEVAQEDTSKGVFALSKPGAKKGDNVSIFTSPTKGFAVNNVLVKDETEAYLPIEIVAKNEYSFVATEYALSVEVTFADEDDVVVINKDVEYEVSVSELSYKGGNVILNSQTATNGQNVEFAVELYDYYSIETIKILTDAGKRIPVNTIGDNLYSFAMVTSNVSIICEYKYNAPILVDHAISVSYTGKGTCISTVDFAKANEKVSIAVEPSKYYLLTEDNISIKSSIGYVNFDYNGKSISFVMPDAEVFVNVNFVPDTSVEYRFEMQQTTDFECEWSLPPKPVHFNDKVTLQAFLPDYSLIVDNTIYIGGMKIQSGNGTDFTFVINEDLMDQSIDGTFFVKYEIQTFDPPVVQDIYVTVVKSEGGSTSLSGNGGRPGQELIVYTKPYPGYFVKEVIATASNGVTIEPFSYVENETYNYFLPDRDLTIEVVYAQYPTVVSLADKSNLTYENPCSVYFTDNANVSSLEFQPGDRVDLSVVVEPDYYLPTFNYNVIKFDGTVDICDVETDASGKYFIVPSGASEVVVVYCFIYSPREVVYN